MCVIGCQKGVSGAESGVRSWGVTRGALGAVGKEQQGVVGADKVR